MTEILVVDDEQSIREVLAIYLQREGYAVTCACDGEEALRCCQRRSYDVVIADIKMPRLDGITLLHRVKELHPDTVFIMITAFASFETAHKSMEDNAYDYLAKPFDVEEVKRKIEAALKQRALRLQQPAGELQAAEPAQFGMFGQSKEMKKIFDIIPRAAASKSNVLITGESGTGKELIARAIHRQSPRTSQPFVIINCGGIPENLLESELFGYRKGAFTGAVKDKKGLLEAATGGTLFLDEIGELPLALQVKLLRMVQEKTFTPVGSTEELKVDVRIISATNKNLDSQVKEGTFREDLFYRLNVIHIFVPPLRERQEDIALLATYFLRKYSQEMGKDIHEISSYAMDCLMRYRFPGNIRELENIIERGIALEKTSIMLPDSLELAGFSPEGQAAVGSGPPDCSIPPEGLALDAILERAERAYVQEALRLSRGSIKGAAKLLGLSFRSMRYRLEKLNMDTARFK